MRIGHGFDVHRFCEGDHVMLGGVRIPYHRGIEAHSDGDVVLHAVCDALLGAAGLGDIGVHFPPSDPSFKGMDSQRFVQIVHDKLKGKGYRVGNVDITLIAESPKIGPHREAIRETIAKLLSLDKDAVNIKATTTERMGYCGREEGLAAHAVVLLNNF